MQVDSDPNALPAGCVRCEYLESSYTQYIDTLYIPTMDTCVKGKLSIVKIIKADELWFGCRNLELGDTRFWCGTSESINFRAAKGLFYAKKAPVKIGVESDFIFNAKDSYNNYFVSFQSYKIVIPSAKFTPKTSIKMFGANNGNSIIFSAIKIFEFCIYEGDILSCNYIPILDANNVPCMYDTVAKKFHYNQGTGQFLYKILEQ